LEFYNNILAEMLLLDKWHSQKISSEMVEVPNDTPKALRE